MTIYYHDRGIGGIQFQEQILLSMIIVSYLDVMYAIQYGCNKYVLLLGFIALFILLCKKHMNFILMHYLNCGQNRAIQNITTNHINPFFTTNVTPYYCKYNDERNIAGDELEYPGLATITDSTHQ